MRKTSRPDGHDAKGAAAGDAERPRVISRTIVLRERILVWDSVEQRFVVVWLWIVRLRRACLTSSLLFACNVFCV